jgi:hypothetical protein
MGFFQELTAELDRTPAKGIDPAGPGAISEVLKYAPLKLRPRRNVEDRLNEEKYWRERACQAEVRVTFLEDSIQRIAARVVKS